MGFASGGDWAYFQEAMEKEPIVELKGVSKSYDSDPDRKVLDGLSLAVSAGDRFAVVGPSGCGKSTLLNILGTLDAPSEGEVVFDGHVLAGMSEKRLAELRSGRVGFIFQLHHLLPQCTALENVLVPSLALAKRPDEKETLERARSLMDRVGLSDKLDSRPSQLSGGERQRVAVVRALINRPKLLLADEPTGALDEDNAGKLVDLLVELNETEQISLVMVSHDLDLADRIGKVVELHAGRIAPATADSASPAE